MALNKVSQLIANVLNNSNESFSKVKESLLASPEYKSLSTAEQKAIQALNVNQIDAFNKGAVRRKKNSQCNINDR